MTKMNNSLLQLKRGTAARWFELNPVLAAGEPGVEYDTKKLKIGDGVTPWRQLTYIGSNDIAFVTEYNSLPSVGEQNRLYSVSKDKALYQWNITEQKYEMVGSNGSFDPNEIKLINGGNANV